MPIGSFQAVKHMLADMYVRTSLARSATYAAAAVLDDPGVDDAGSGGGVGQAPRRRGRDRQRRRRIQVLGGMGFTWDMLPNYLLKRAWVLEHALRRRPTTHALAPGLDDRDIAGR